MNLLHIDTSIRGEQSVSRLLSRATVQRMQEHDPAIDVIYRDLVATPVPHLTGEHLLGSLSVKEEIALGEELLEEFISADVVVIGVAFYLKPAQGVDRPHCGSGEDVPLHGERFRGSGV